MDGLQLLDIPVVSPPTLGDYQLVAEIGRGGMADVYLALTQPVKGKSNQVVIKRLRSDVLDEDDFRAMFVDEARLAMKLRHPNVVKTFDVGKDGDACFIVMEFLDGQPLSRVRGQARRANAAIPLSIHLRVLCDVLSGLHYVHELADFDGVSLGVVHRDVTPQNIFVTYDGLVKVVDFGIAKARAREVETRVGVVKGKLSYLAPENVRGEPVDRRSDIFSVGVMLWEAASGRRFWQGADELAIYQRLASGELPTASAASEMSPQLFAIVERALARNPKHRFATAAQMRAALVALPQVPASGSAVSGYLYQLFVEERRRFHQRLSEELSRLQSGKWPIELPSLRPDAVPSSTPVGKRGDGRDAPISKPDPAAPNSVGTTVTTFTAQSPRPVAPAPKARSSISLVAALAAGALVLAIWMVIRDTPRARSVSSVGTAAEPPLSAAVVEPPSQKPTAPPDPGVDPSSLPEAPKPFPPQPAFVKAATKKADPPESLPDLVRAPRPRRHLDADDPWAQ